MLAIQNFDITRLRVRLNEFKQFTGKSDDEVVRNQGGLLMRDLVKDAPPKNLAESQRKAEGFAKNVFAPMPNDTFQSTQRGQGDIAWLYSGPQFILGTARGNYQPNLSTEAMRSVYAKESRKKTFGKRYERIGKRGQQAVIRLNRMVVRRGNLRQFTAGLRNTFGKLKGAWSEGWDLIGVKASLPNWIRRHHGKGRGSFLLTSGTKPTLTLINRANGVESEYSRRAISHALRRRAGAIAADIRRQIQGNYRRAGFKNAKGFSLN